MQAGTKQTETASASSGKREMRFLFIIDTLETGGAERMVLSLAESLVRMGHDVSLLVIKDSIRLTVPEGIKLHILGYKKILFAPYNLIYAARMRRYIKALEAKDGKFDLIVANLNLSCRLSHLSKMKGVYYCIHEAVSPSSLARRRGLKRYFRRLRLKRILNGKDIITVSTGIEDDLLNVVGVRPGSIRTIYNAVSFNRILSMAERYDNGIESDYLVHVGRLDKLKRHDILLKAFKVSGVNCKLVLVGEGHARKDIEKEIERLGLDNQVVMMGYVENPYPVIKDAMLMLLSSDYEGLPTVLLESFVLSTPVVSVDCYFGPREILGEKYARYLAKVGDVKDLADKIRLGVDDVRSNRLRVSHDHIRRFDIESSSGEYIKLAQQNN